MSIPKRTPILVLGTGLVAVVLGFGAGWFHGMSKGAETMAALSDGVAAGRAFSQAELALAGLEDATAAEPARKRDAAQLRMALDVLGGIALSGHWHPPCEARHARTQAAIIRHFTANPIATDDPASPILRAGQRYCDRGGKP